MLFFWVWRMTAVFVSFVTAFICDDGVAVAHRDLYESYSLRTPFLIQYMWLDSDRFLRLKWKQINHKVAGIFRNNTNRDYVVCEWSFCIEMHLMIMQWMHFRIDWINWQFTVHVLPMLILVRTCNKTVWCRNILHETEKPFHLIMLCVRAAVQCDSGLWSVYNQFRK